MTTDNKETRSTVLFSNLRGALKDSASLYRTLKKGQQQYQTPPFLVSRLHGIELAIRRELYNQRKLDFGLYLDGAILDPQCGINHMLTQNTGYGVDVDIRCELNNMVNKRTIVGSSVSFSHVWDIYEEQIGMPLEVLSLRANPPYGLLWRDGDDKVDSTLWTWEWFKRIATHRSTGIFICNRSTFERFGWDKDPRVAYILYCKGSALWDDMSDELEIACAVLSYGYTVESDPIISDMQTPLQSELMRELGISMADTLVKTRFTDGNIKAISDTRTPANVKNYLTDAKGVDGIRIGYDSWAELSDLYNKLKRRDGSEYAIDINRKGLIEINLSIVEERALKKKATKFRKDLIKLNELDGVDPLVYVSDRKARQSMEKLIDSGIYKTSPAFDKAVRRAIAESVSISVPIMPVTDFEKVAYTDELDHLTVRVPPSEAFGWTWCKMTKGEKVPFSTSEYTYSEKFIREKASYSRLTGEKEVRPHEVELTVKDRRIQFNHGHTWFYFQNTNERMEKAFLSVSKDTAPSRVEIPEHRLWDVFEEPVVKTIKENNPDAYNEMLMRVELHAMMTGFQYYEGQKDFCARLAVKNFGLVAAETGCGKSLIALTLAAIKNPRRTLIIAPKGTTKGAVSVDKNESGDKDMSDEEVASQWFEEVRRFLPEKKAYRIFRKKDVERILAENNGVLPDGVYVTYPSAFFMNESLEHLSGKMSERHVFQNYLEKVSGVKLSDDVDYREGLQSDSLFANTGEIRCVVNPSISTLIGDQFDMVCLDEAHLITNLDALITQKMHFLQPKYRYALTATPIPNVASDLFSIMGWLCVPDWWKGGRRNAAWPFMVGQKNEFNKTFLSEEVDYTAKRDAIAEGRKSSGKKTSPIISNAALLLKIIKPTVAFLPKQACNENQVPCSVEDIRVPMNRSQAKLYAEYLEDQRILQDTYPKSNAMVLAAIQSTVLRGVCADPMGDWNKRAGTIAKTSITPKTLTMLGLVAQCLKEGEQVIVVSARQDQNNIIQKYLQKCGVPVSRIDATTGSRHAEEASNFKEGKTAVLIMGIKCAQAHSFHKCCRMIIGSLEWSYGTLDQTKGRVWRVNSEKEVKIWVVLHKNSIEELLYERVGTKQDSASLCLRGARVPRGFIQKDPSEILAEHLRTFNEDSEVVEDETAIESMNGMLKGIEESLVAYYNFHR